MAIEWRKLFGPGATGYSGEEVRVKGSEVGFEHYLVKPAGLEDLKRVIPEIT
jgi:DNA-binding response OmpR family regulator